MLNETSEPVTNQPCTRQWEAHKMLTHIAARAAKESFTKMYQHPDNFDERCYRGLGCAIAAHAHWDGIRIMEIFAAALEDANWHTECAIVLGWVETQSGLK